MTFQELRRGDREGAFLHWVSVREAKALKKIPEKYWVYFNDHCSCGSENIIKMNLKSMMCCNPKCSVKQGYAIAELLSRFGVKGLKEATCSKIYEAFVSKDTALKKMGKEGILRSDSYVACLSVRWEDYPIDVAGTAKGAEFFGACQKILSGPLTFPQLVSKLAIPSVGGNGEKLAAGFVCFRELFDAIKAAGSTSEFCASRGFRSELLAYHFRTSLFDIATADSIFNRTIKPEGLVKLSVCMTGMVSLGGERCTKEEYVKRCNRLCQCNGVQLLEVKMTGAKETNPFILYSRESGDAKFVAGKRRGVVSDAFGTHPVLVHTDVFYRFIEEVVAEWEQSVGQSGLEDSVRIFPTILTTAMKRTVLAGKRMDAF